LSSHYKKYLQEKNQKSLETKQANILQQTKIQNMYHKINNLQLFENQKIYKDEIFIQRCEIKNLKQCSGVFGKNLTKISNDSNTIISSSGRSLIKYGKVDEEYEEKLISYFPSLITKIRWNSKTSSYYSSHIGHISHGHIFESTDNSTKSIYSLFHKSIHTFEFSNDHKQMSVGASKSSFLVDVETQKNLVMLSKTEDVLSQKFFQHFVLNGQRDGMIKFYDVRKRNISKFNINMGSTVVSMEILKNEIHLIANSMNGNLFLFDLRNLKHPVIQFQGHSNKSEFFNFSIDEEENHLFIGSDDQLLNVYDLKFERVKKSIGPFQENITDIILDENKYIFGSKGNIWVMNKF
jgi:WD40 repeat protein